MLPFSHDRSLLERVSLFVGRPRSLKAVSLNLGDRNSNPLEFVLDGDESEIGLQATDLRKKAEDAMVDSEHGNLNAVLLYYWKMAI